MEGEGLALHLEFEQTKEDYLEGRDPVLEYALPELQSYP